MLISRIIEDSQIIENTQTGLISPAILNIFELEKRKEPMYEAIKQYRSPLTGWVYWSPWIRLLTDESLSLHFTTRFQEEIRLQFQFSLILLMIGLIGVPLGFIIFGLPLFFLILFLGLFLSELMLLVFFRGSIYFSIPQIRIKKKDEIAKKLA